MPPIAHSIASAILATDGAVGRTSFYDAIRRGDLVARKLGRRTVILDSDLRRWLDELPRLTSASTDGAQAMPGSNDPERHPATGAAGT